MTAHTPEATQSGVQGPQDAPGSRWLTAGAGSAAENCTSCRYSRLEPSPTRSAGCSAVNSDLQGYGRLQCPAFGYITVSSSP